MAESGDERTLVLRREFDAPPEAVFRAWTTPELLMQWFTPKPYQTVAADLDVRAGGVCNITMRSPEGQDIPNPGVYLEVVPNRRLVFTDAFTEGWVPGADAPFMVGTIEFEPLPGGRTAYTAKARHWSVEATKQHDEMGFHAGWGAAADQLAEVLAAMKAEEARAVTTADIDPAATDGAIP
jgi:uncharacterized protein YndB with AHSA1/START domain